MIRFPHNPYRKQLAVLTSSTWLVLALMVFVIRPEFVSDVGWKNGYLPFFVLLFLSLFWSGWMITGRWKRSGLWSVIATVFVWLRINQLASVINIVLLLGFGFVWEYYWQLACDKSSV